jgi:alpha-1,2-mannosyltransferase
MTPPPGDLRPYRREWVVIGLFALLILGYGVLTEIRSCFLKFTHTDFGMLARAGWAVRTGQNIYEVTEAGGLHYTYPAPFSVFMTPLADPAPGHDRAGYLPYPVSVGLWYVISLGFVFYAVHALARAALPDALPGSRRWWYARTAPLAAVLGGVGFSLGKGQVTLLLVALGAAGFAAAVRGRRYASGAWLAAAAVIKVIPAYLFLYPLVRRDRRAGVGAAAAAVVGLVALPAAVWGWGGMVEKHQDFYQHVLVAGTTGAGGERYGKELTKTTATDSQSFQAAIHHLRHSHLERKDRPDHADGVTRAAHWVVSGLLTGITLLVARRRLTADPADQLVLFGSLSALMTIVTPVSHMHYYAFVLPLASGLWVRSVSRRPGAAVADGWTIAALAGWAVATALPLFPGWPFDQLREYGFATLATVGLWAYAMTVMGRTGRTVEVVVPEPLRRAA